MATPIIKHYKVLSDLIHKNNFKIFAEIGVWKSQTTKKVLKAVGAEVTEYWAVDQWHILGREHGRMARRTQQNWDDMYRYACNLMTWFPCLRVLRLESAVAASLFKDKHFDFVYLDASHFYEDVKRDLEIWIPKVRDGGMIGGHDYTTTRREHKGVRVAVDEVFGKDEVYAYSNGSQSWTYWL